MGDKKRRGPGNRPQNAADNAAEAARQARRDEAWRMSAIDGLTQQQIADHFKVDVSTICRDLHRARVEHRPKDLAERVAQSAARLEHIYDSLRAGVDSGDPQSCAAAIKAIDVHAKLLGMHAPERKELSGSLRLEDVLLADRASKQNSE